MAKTDTQDSVEPADTQDAAAAPKGPSPAPTRSGAEKPAGAEQHKLSDLYQYAEGLGLQPHVLAGAAHAFEWDADHMLTKEEAEAACEAWLQTPATREEG